MAVLELHRGGLDPENVARVEEEAARILRELADSLPKADPLHEAADLLAEELWLRVSGRDFKARRAARKNRLADRLGWHIEED